jgi:hypothetical protein
MYHQLPCFRRVRLCISHHPLPLRVLSSDTILVNVLFSKSSVFIISDIAYILLQYARLAIAVMWKLLQILLRLTKLSPIVATIAAVSLGELSEPPPSSSSSIHQSTFDRNNIEEAKTSVTKASRPVKHKLHGSQPVVRFSRCAHNDGKQWDSTIIDASNPQDLWMCERPPRLHNSQTPQGPSHRKWAGAVGRGGVWLLDDAYNNNEEYESCSRSINSTMVCVAAAGRQSSVTRCCCRLITGTEFNHAFRACMHIHCCHSW